MINYLSIYKFSFPFIEYKYERTLFFESVNDFEKLLKYNDLYLKTINKETKIYKIKIIKFSWWTIEVYLNKENTYYIPKYQFELFFDKEINSILIQNIIKIFVTFWIKNYIFDFSKNIEKYINNKNIVTETILQKDFESFGEKKIIRFLKTVNHAYISEKLKSNTQIRNSFNFLIYKCFLFYKNYINSEKQINEILDLEKSNITTEYSWVIKLSLKRLEYINNINLHTFKKYNLIIDNFFDLLK